MPKPIVIEIVDLQNTIGHENPRPIHYRATIEPHNPITKCAIEFQYEKIIPEGWNNDANGFSFCRPGDIYDYETGCRLALTSALRKVSSGRVREMFWKAYLELFPVEKRTSQKELLFQDLKERMKKILLAETRPFTTALFDFILASKAARKNGSRQKAELPY